MVPHRAQQTLMLPVHMARARTARFGQLKENHWGVGFTLGQGDPMILLKLVNYGTLLLKLVNYGTLLLKLVFYGYPSLKVVYYSVPFS